MGITSYFSLPLSETGTTQQNFLKGLYFAYFERLFIFEKSVSLQNCDGSDRNSYADFEFDPRSCCFTQSPTKHTQSNRNTRS